MMRRTLSLVMLTLFAWSGCADRKAASIPTPPGTSPASAPATRTHTPKALPKPYVPDTKALPKAPLEEPPLLLVPAMAGENKDRLEHEVTTRIRQTERLVARANLRHLTTQESETFSAIQSFLAKAKEALEQQDVPRALNLAEKAHALAEDLPSNHLK